VQIYLVKSKILLVTDKIGKGFIANLTERGLGLGKGE